jgi:hypothetical protein
MTKIKLIKSLLHTFKKIDSIGISNGDTFYITQFKNSIATRLVIIKSKETDFKLREHSTLLTKISAKLLNPKLTKLIESFY